MNFNKEQKPDTKPGHYYVTAVDGARIYGMAGPFVNDHASALAAVDKVRQFACEEDGRASFMLWGTARYGTDVTQKGRLNHLVGLPS